MKRLISFEESLKVSIVKEVESGKYSQLEACRAYGMSRSSLQKWLKIYGKLREKIQIVRVQMSDEKEKIKELKAALADAQLETRFYKKLVEIGKKKYGLDLKKKSDMGVFESLKKKDVE